MITPECGVHCGIASGNEGHCQDPECHDGPVPELGPLSQDPIAARLGLVPEPGIPMCDRWYAGVAVRPWIRYLDGCLCGVSAQALPQQHGPRCPVRRQSWVRDQASSCPACGSEERSEAGYVPGASGQPVTCASDWHDDDACSPGDHADEAAGIIAATGA
jgi:hypothetical protein